MNGIKRMLRTAAILVVFGSLVGLTACQTEKIAHRNFSPERRTSLEPGGPHAGKADTVTVIVDYRYTIIDKQKSARSIQIEGGISQFKMKPDSMTLHIHFLDAQGTTIEQRLIYSLGHRQGRDSFIRPSTAFNTTLAVPDETVYFAINSRTRLSRGRR